jgi:uncharacterized membrane protein
MNPRYLWVTEAMELLTFFVIGPAIAIVIAYWGWRGKRQTLSAKRHGIVCAACGGTGSVLLMLAKWINADIRTPQFFVQLTCVLLGLLLFFVGIGSYFPVLLHIWRWHKKTRLAYTRRQNDEC